MGSRLRSIATPESEFQYGIDTRQVIPDTKNIKGELWLYVNNHPDNKDLIKALKKLQPQPARYSQSNKKGPSVFGYEFVFTKGPKAIRDIRKAGFKIT